MAVRIQMRRGAATSWNATDPVLAEGEFGFDTTAGQLKIGTGNTSWTNLDYLVTDSSLGTSLGDYIELAEKGSTSGVAELDSERNLLVPNSSIIFEGSSVNEFETTFTVTNPTADRTITLPDVAGTVITTGNLTSITEVGTLTSLTVSGNLTVNGTTTTINSTTLTVDDINIVLASGNTSDATLDGAGLTLEATTSKTFVYQSSTSSFLSSEHMNLASGKKYKINGTDITASMSSVTWGDLKNGKNLSIS